MTTHMVVFLKDGHVQSVLSDFPGDMQCLIVQANDDAMPSIQGEPWVKPMAFPETDSLQAVLEPVAVEFDPERVRKIMSLEKLSRDELLKLLG